MKAAIYERRGPAREVLQIVDRRIPEPGPGEVRVRIAVSAVNPSDTKARTQWRGDSQMPYPVITPHQDGAGTIDRVGAGVSTDRIGQRVWLYMAQRGRPFGTAAEYTVVPSERAVELPQTASFDDGACLGIPALTAHYALFSDGALCCQTVLVQGGAGAVGFYAVQLAKWGGARKVIATVSREEQAAQARLAGADVVVNYTRADAIAAIRDGAGGDAAVDRIIEVDFGANVAMDLAVIARNGVVASYGSDADPEPKLPYAAFSRKNVTLRMALIYEAPQSAREAATRDINLLLETRGLRHQVATRFPLDQIVEAHEAQETRKIIGKVLVGVAD
ncbi:MAG: NADPH:quinone reductase [Hyphomicrobiaceae bacterium]